MNRMVFPMWTDSWGTDRRTRQRRRIRQSGVLCAGSARPV